MQLLPTVSVKNLYSESEIDLIMHIITKYGLVRTDTGSYQDSGAGGKFAGKLIAKWIDIDFDQIAELQELLLPKLNKAMNQDLIIQDVHVLESHIPYLVHNDVASVRGLELKIKDHLKHLAEAYTIIIPIETYDSCTVIFNETLDYTNDFAEFKKNYQGDQSLKLDKQLILDRLTHLHPTDFKYLTFNSMHFWDQGSMFAVDRRYFHCSDNFTKRGIVSKKGIIIRTLCQKD